MKDLKSLGFEEFGGEGVGVLVGFELVEGSEDGFRLLPQLVALEGPRRVSQVLHLSEHDRSAHDVFHSLDHLLAFMKGVVIED